jgi:chromosome partitioning protein
MRVVSLGQQKGGVGKSATAIHLAMQAVLAGKRTALLDMDNVQKTALTWARKRKEGVGEEPLLTVLPVDVVNLDETLEALRAEGVEWVFIDMPGRRDGVGKGLAVADFILMPARPLAMDIEASYGTLLVLRRGEKAERYAYLMSICPPQDNASRARKIKTVLEEQGCTVCPVIIIQRIVVPDAIEFGKHAGEMRDGAQSAAEYATLFDWLNSKIEDKDGKRTRRKATA